MDSSGAEALIGSGFENEKPEADLWSSSPITVTNIRQRSVHKATSTPCPLVPRSRHIGSNLPGSLSWREQANALTEN
jgi:hypothetical protein